MDNLDGILVNAISPNNEIRNKASSQLLSLVLDQQLLELSYSYFLDQKYGINQKKLLATVIKNYVSKYLVSTFFFLNFLFKNLDSDEARAANQKIMTPEAITLFKKMSLALIEVAGSELTPLIRQWIEIIYTENKGYMMIWRELAQSLSAMLDKKNYFLSSEIYELVATITNRYTEELKSYVLFEEIIDCMNNFCAKMTNDANMLIQHFLNTNLNLNDTINNEIYLKILKNIIQIAFNFNYQDFPEFFEDNLETWIKILYNTCTLVTKPIASTNPRSTIEVNYQSLKMLNIYISNYYEDIKKYADAFQEPIWTLFNSINLSNNLNEKINLELLEYYKIMFMIKKINLNQEKVNTLITKLIFPNLNLTDKEIEDFEENEVAFMKSEIEEIEDQTSKSNAISLLKIINSQFDDLYTQIVKPYYSQLLQSYTADPKNNWRNKISAINMIFSTIIQVFSTTCKLITLILIKIIKMVYRT